jgi:pSer/pThr/pTyr-binding forkhead associated (FHA) protein
MHNTKANILKAITPKAVLLPLTKEANKSIVKGPCNNELITMSAFPFKIGRESRLGENERGLFLKLRMITNASKPNNDIYLYNSSKNLQISKEHFQIERNLSKYTIKDRGSSKGTTINGITYGGNKEVFEQTLNDGDIIIIGDKTSDLKYQFLILENI